MMALFFLKWGAVLLGASAIALLVHWGSLVPVPMAMRLGHRGLMRRRALLGEGLFPTFEPLMRYLAGIVSLLPLDRLREKQEKDLLRADYPLGLTPDELMALSALGAVFLGGTAFGLSAVVEVFAMDGVLKKSWAIGFLGLLLGLMLPTMQVRRGHSRTSESGGTRLAPSDRGGSDVYGRWNGLSGCTSPALQ